jgi:phosphatidylglycerophosphate synthase
MKRIKVSVRQEDMTFRPITSGDQPEHAETVGVGLELNPRTDLGGPQLVAKTIRKDTSWSISGHRKYLASSSLLISAVSQLVLIGGAFLTIAVLLGSVLPLSWRCVVAALGCYGIVTALVLTGLPRHAPHRCFGLANSVTLTRASLTALLWGVVAELLFGNALVLDFQMRWLLVFGASAALLSDGLDGWAARRSGMASDFGAHFDMEVDALFLLVLSILVYATGEVGAWVIASGVLRYAFVLSGFLWPRLAMPLSPLWRRKAICVLQFTVLIVALAPMVPAAAARMFCLGGLALLCYSFAADLIWLTSKSQPQSLGCRRACAKSHS